MKIPKDLIKFHPGLSDWCILHCYRGSIAHGMYIPNKDPISIDDKDTMALCVPPKDYYIGLKGYGSHNRGTREVVHEEWDIVIYEIKKAIRLLLKGNPNILSMLWVEDKHYIKLTSAGRHLVDNRHLFVGKHVYRSFTGYAHSQMKKMTHFNFDGYMGSKRKAIVEKFGYDVKNAAHLIRLLRMGIEFLTEGVLYVERHDAAQLLSIKRGEWELDAVKDLANDLFKRSEDAYVSSKLPDRPNKELVNDICIEIIELAWQGR